MTDFEPGLYDELVDELMNDRLSGLAAGRLAAEIDGVDPAELPDRIGELVGRWARQTLASVGADRRAAVALGLSQVVLDTMSGLQPDAIGPGQALVAPVRRLAAIEKLAPTDEPIPIRRPLTPLRDTVLMTNARGQPAVGREISAEIDSADRIDLVLAFIRWTGIRELLPHLRRHAEAGKPLRIITTTYTGSTELRALEALADLGAEIKVSYDTSTTRLHAKAWLFQRSSGFSTAYIGSSNLTFSAQVTGLEWNVRASQRLNPDLLSAVDRTFASYWADPHFESFDAQRFEQATAVASGDDSISTPFDVEPYPFQRQILERLQVERRKGNPHNLIAAATGTGKTIMAALDYRHLRQELSPSRLLFERTILVTASPDPYATTHETGHVRM